MIRRDPVPICYQTCLPESVRLIAKNERKAARIQVSVNICDHTASDVVRLVQHYGKIRAADLPCGRDHLSVYLLRTLSDRQKAHGADESAASETVCKGEAGQARDCISSVHDASYRFQSATYRPKNATYHPKNAT